MAAGGLRRPPTKSPNRIPFGSRASLRRVNNVFTRRFGSFAVSGASPSSLIVPGPVPELSCAYMLYPSLLSFSLFLMRSRRALPYFFLITRPHPCTACGRSACCTFHGCLQLGIMNIDNTARRRRRDRWPFQCKYPSDFSGLLPPARSARPVLANARDHSARSLASAILAVPFSRVTPALCRKLDLSYATDDQFCSEISVVL